MLSLPDFSPLPLCGAQPNVLPNSLLSEANALSEHYKMSLTDSLNIGLSLAEMYRNSPTFELNSKNMESEHRFRNSLLEGIGSLIKIMNRR